ncbi:MAG: FAD-binding oxidoreductase [Halobacteria archaeon]
MPEGPLAEMAVQGRFTEGWKVRFGTGEAVGPLTTFLDLLVRTTPDYVARPRDGAEAAEVVKFAAAQKMAVVPRGAGTSSSGGSIPVGGGIIVDTSEMSSLEIDADDLRAVAGAGVPMKRLVAEAAAKGLEAGPHPLFGPASTVGSFLGRGGWGLGSLRLGSFASRVADAEVVLGNGEVLPADGPTALAFAGAEGLLGIFTRATLRLEPKPEEVRPLGFLFERARDLSEAVGRLNAAPLPLHAILFGEANHYRWLLRERGEIGAPYMLNAVLAGPKPLLAKAESRVNALVGGAKPARESGNREWKAVHEIYRFPVDYFHPLRWPLLLPADRLGDFAQGFRALLARMKLHGSFTGVAVARGTLLVEPYPLLDLRRPFGTLFALGLVKKMNDLALELGGQPGGYGLLGTGHLDKLHGDFVDPLQDAKGQLLGPQILRIRSSAGVEVLLRAKKGLDPSAVLNPGKITSLRLTPAGLLPVKLPAATMNVAQDALAIGRRLVKGEELLST